MNNRKIYFLFFFISIFLLHCNFILSQQFTSAQRYGGINSEAVTGMATDNEGNIYITGVYLGNTKFGQYFLSNQGYTDIFIIKLDVVGNVQWAKTIGGNSEDASRAICVNSDGIYLTGSFSFSAKFENIRLNSEGTKDIFACKFDFDGNLIWTKRAGGQYNNESGYTIVSDKDGNIYVGGQFMDSADFDTFCINSHGYEDIFISKLDPDGNFLWVKSAGGVGGDDCIVLGIDSYDNLYASGKFQSTAHFGSSVIRSNGSSDIYVCKLNSSGEFLNIISFGGESSENTSAMDITPTGECFLSGESFSDYIDFGNYSLAGMENKKIFITKISGNLEFIWVNQIKGSNSNYIYSMKVDKFGNSYVIGQFMNRVSLGTKTLSSRGNEDIFISALSSNGNFLWSKQAGGIGGDDGKALVIDESGKILASGKFGNSCQFDKLTISSKGQSDVFLTSIGSEKDELGLTSFSYSSEKQSVILKWITTKELNNHGFEILRNDLPVGFIKSGGKTGFPHSYSLTDEPPFSGNYIYKLIQINLDGKRKEIARLSVEYDRIITK